MKKGGETTQARKVVQTALSRVERQHLDTHAEHLRAFLYSVLKV